jgi:hypothetical protein
MARNRMMRKNDTNSNVNDSSDTDENIKQEKVFKQETNNRRDKRETIMGANLLKITSEKEGNLQMPETVKLDLEEIDDDEDIANNYGVNTVQGETALSKYTSSIIPNGNTLQMTMQDKKSPLKHKQTGKHIVRIRVNGKEIEQEINKQLYKYRLVRILMERYVPNDPEENGIYTLFQTNSEILKIYSQLTEIKMDENNKGETNNFKRLQTRIKANSPLSGNRAYMVMVGLLNKKIFRIDYETSKYLVPIENKIVAERVFRTHIAQKQIDDNQKKVFAKMSHSSRSNELNFTHQDEHDVYKTNTTTIIEKSPMSSSKNMLSKEYTQFFDSISIVKALQYYNDHRVMITVLLSQNEKSKKLSLRVHGQYKMKPYTEIIINFDQSFRTSLNENYFIGSLKIPKKNHKDPEYEFFVYSSIFIATFKFHLKSNLLEFNNFLKKEASSNLRVQFSMNRKLFYIPINSQVLIYDQSLTHFIYRIETKRNIDETILLDNLNLMIIYDRRNYYELDLDELKFQKTLSVCTDKLESFEYMIDFNLLNSGIQWNATFHTKNKHRIVAVPFKENFKLSTFPFEDLLKCFLKKNYKKYLITYSKYYFTNIEKTQRKDYLYGSLNPLLFAIYHNDSNLLEDLLDKFFYPKQINKYVSPLEYSFAMNYRTTIKVLCDYLIGRDYFVHFTRADFKNLLKSNILTCHKLIATIPSKPAINILPKLVYMTSNVNAIFHDYLTSLLIYIKLEDAKYIDDDPKETEFVTLEVKENQDINSDMGLDLLDKEKTDIDLEIEETTKRYVEDHISNDLFKSEVTIKSVPFKYNYDFGTEDSVTFIYNYSNSENEDFILSDWKQIVKKKWIGVKFPYIFVTFCYFAYMLFFVLSTVFYDKTKGLRTIALIFNIILIFFEVIQMITYFGYKPSM